MAKKLLIVNIQISRYHISEGKYVPYAIKKTKHLQHKRIKE
jgi:hypothetical protein